VTLSEVTVGQKKEMEFQEEKIKLHNVVEIELLIDNENWHVSIKN